MFFSARNRSLDVVSSAVISSSSNVASVLCGQQVIEVAKLMKAYINQIVKLRRASYLSQASSEASDSYM